MMKTPASTIIDKDKLLHEMVSRNQWGTYFGVSQDVLDQVWSKLIDPSGHSVSYITMEIAADRDVFNPVKDRLATLELSGSTRALALGGAFALGFQDADAVFHQPGVLDRAQGFGGSIQRFGSSGALTTLSAGGSWLSGGIALGVQHLSYGANATTPIDGADLLSLSRDPGSLRANGDVGVSELVLSLGYVLVFHGEVFEHITVLALIGAMLLSVPLNLFLCAAHVGLGACCSVRARTTQGAGLLLGGLITAFFFLVSGLAGLVWFTDLRADAIRFMAWMAERSFWFQYLSVLFLLVAVTAGVFVPRRLQVRGPGRP